MAEHSSVVLVVDSSVWIASLRGQQSAATQKLELALAREQVLVGDLILLELLQGARNDVAAARIESGFRRFPIVAMLNADLAVSAARNYRKLRSIGITVRKTADLVIGTFCIERRHTLLHADRDFDPLEQHLGLKVL